MIAHDLVAHRGWTSVWYHAAVGDLRKMINHGFSLYKKQVVNSAWVLGSYFVVLAILRYHLHDPHYALLCFNTSIIAMTPTVVSGLSLDDCLAVDNTPNHHNGPFIDKPLMRKHSAYIVGDTRQ